MDVALVCDDICRLGVVVIVVPIVAVIMGDRRSPVRGGNCGGDRGRPPESPYIKYYLLFVVC